MKAFLITLFACITMNYPMNASAKERQPIIQLIRPSNAKDQLATLSAAQKSALVYLFWQPFFCQSAQEATSLTSQLGTAINEERPSYFYTMAEVTATIPNLLLNDTPLRSYIRYIDTINKRVTVSCTGFSYLDTPFDQLVPTMNSGQELLESRGYDLFANSCISLINNELVFVSNNESALASDNHWAFVPQ